MTNLEALKGEIEPFSVSSTALEKRLVDNGLDSSSEYTSDNGKLLALCALSVLSSMLSLAGETMGKMSSSYSREGIKDKISSLCNEYGIDSSLYSNTPKVIIS